MLLLLNVLANEINKLISSPQSVVDRLTLYVFTEGRLESADIEALSSDHPFINVDWLQPAETFVLSFVLRQKIILDIQYVKTFIIRIL